VNRGFWVAPFNFTDDQVQRLLAAWADSGGKRAKAKAFIKRAESVTALWMALRPAHDTDAEIRNRAEAVRKATENLLNVLAGASMDFELRLNSVSRDARYFEQLAEEGEDDYLSPFESLTSPKFTAALRVMSRSCAVIQKDIPSKTGRNTGEAKALVGGLFDAWKKEYGKPPSSAKAGNFARFIGVLSGILNIEIGTQTIEDAVKEKTALISP